MHCSHHRALQSEIQYICSRADNHKPFADETIAGARLPQLSSLSPDELYQLLESTSLVTTAENHLPLAFQNRRPADLVWLKLLGIPEINLSSTQLPGDCFGSNPTPVELVLELTSRIRFFKNDTFLDVGCGRGEVALLIAKLTQATVEGFDCQRKQINFARSIQRRLPEIQARFSHCTAVTADLSRATIIYMYYPFRGTVHDDFMRRVKAQSYDRPLVICSLGETTNCLAELDWLTPMTKGEEWEQIAIFTSDVESFTKRQFERNLLQGTS